ncbi:hypothetical protein [Streptomyces sp. NPDC059003]|uniref:hypothetical protein n=1 Tax=Streptomyces sp. NPDC059003 TaxID=3346691 RepID=UPI0036A004FD
MTSPSDRGIAHSPQTSDTDPIGAGLQPTTTTGMQDRGAEPDPTFTPLNCSLAECIVGEYRDDLTPAPEHNAPEADFACSGCGHLLMADDLIVEAGQTPVVRDHVLGVINTHGTSETEASTPQEASPHQHGPHQAGPALRVLPADSEEREPANSPLSAGQEA